MKTSIRKYVLQHLPNELLAIENSKRVNELLMLTNYEKAVIYKYSNDGYESLNEHLRNNNGINDTQFGISLEQALHKLPDYAGVVFRGLQLSQNEINRYRNAHTNNSVIHEHSFLSATVSVSIANNVPGRNYIFIINSKTGKSIEKIAKFGLHNLPNEQEVLFIPDTPFKVLDVVNEIQYTLITLEEIIL